MCQVSDCEKWLVAQIATDFMAHVCEFVRVLQDRGALTDSGFILPGSGPVLSLRLS